MRDAQLLLFIPPLITILLAVRLARRPRPCPLHGATDRSACVSCMGVSRG